MDELIGLVSRLGYAFDDRDLLERAMAHRSWCSENPGNESNERLEFLGDAVLGWIVADATFRDYPELPEGALTDLRKSVVNAGALADVAAQIGLGKHLLLGKGEAAAGGAEKQSILSDAFEALLGAIYLDGGPTPVRHVIEDLVVSRIDGDLKRLETHDFKTELQELAAAAGWSAPSYRVTSTGPDHDKTFTARVLIEGVERGSGMGGSKKRAEQAAAQTACDGWDELLAPAGATEGA